MRVRRDNVKRAFNITYLGGVLDEMMSGDTITSNVINKLNNKLKFLYRKNIFLSTELPRMLCITLIQPHFDYACPDWHHNLLTKRKRKQKLYKTNASRFGLRLDNMHHTSEENFGTIYWLPASKRRAFTNCVHDYDHVRKVHTNGVTRAQKFLHSTDSSQEK